MIAYHGKESIKQEYLKRVRDHAAADQIIKADAADAADAASAASASAAAAANFAADAARSKWRVAQSEKLLELFRKAV